MSNARTLADGKKLSPGDARATELEKCAEKWKEQISSVVRYLHDHGITVGGRTGDNPWSYINQYTVHIAPGKAGDTFESADIVGLAHSDAWLMLLAGITVDEVKDQSRQRADTEGHDEDRFAEREALDWEAVEKVFQF